MVECLSSKLEALNSVSRAPHNLGMVGVRFAFIDILTNPGANLNERFYLAKVGLCACL